MAWIDGNSFQYHSRGFSSTVNRTAGTGQSGLPSLRFTAGLVQGALYGFTARSELIIGFCYKCDGNTGNAAILEYRLSGSSVFQLQFDTTGALAAVDTSGTDTERGRSASGVINVNVETYIECRVLFSTTVGQVEVRINGDPTPVLNLTGVDTGGASVNEFQFSHNPVHGDEDFSAWYFLDTTTATWASGADDSFLGHIRYAPLDPTGNGNTSQFNGSDGNSTDNYLLVDDGASSINHDSDTTYVESATVGNKDTYGMENLPTTPLTIYAVIPVIIAKKTDAGTRGLTPVIRSGGTDYDAATEHFLGTSYDAYTQAIDQNPNGPAAWNETTVNAMELGVKVTT